MSVGSQDGITVGALYRLTNGERTAARLRIVSVAPASSVALIEGALPPVADGAATISVAVGDTVELSLPSIRPVALSLPKAPAPAAVQPPGASFTPLNPVPLQERLAPLALVPPPATTTQAATTTQVVPATGAATVTSALFTATSTTVLALSPQGEVTLSAGREQGVRPGDLLPVMREGQRVGQVRVRAVEAVRSIGTFEPTQPGTVLAVGESVLLEGKGRAPSPLRIARNGDYLAMLGATLLVLAAPRDPARDIDRQVTATQQFSAISPFPGGGYSVLPSGEIAPGGALQVNMPIAYVPHELSGVVGVYAAQNRRGDSLGSADGRNGTLNAGLGFGVRGRGVWLSRMGLSTISLGGGDSVYNLAVQLAPETSRFPALAVGAQDVTNRRERAPFVVATKALGSSRPLYASVGLGKGRFSTVFGGLSYSPLRRLALTAEYDGLQINLGAGVSITRRFTLLVSANDLSSSDHRPIGELGRRYQLGGTLTF